MRPLIYLLGFLAAPLMIASCGQEAPPPEPVIRPVRFIEAQTTDVQRQRIFTGLARASLESKLSFKVAGTIEALPVEVGNRVKKGQLIAGLDGENFRLQVQEAQAGLASAQAQSRNAEAAYGRTRELWVNKNASQSDLDGARAAAESVAQQVKSLEKSLERARLQLSYTRLEAPAAGAIAEVSSERGENVGAGQIVALLSSDSRLEVEVAVPEVLIAQITQGAPVAIAFDALPGLSFSGSVSEVGVAATGGSSTFPVVVLLEKSDPACRPGMAADVSFQFGSNNDAPRLLLPPAAVAEDRQGRFVYVLERAETGYALARRRPVQVGEIDADGLEINEGVANGELVVTAGVSRLVDGQKVRLLDAE
jgi:membrane fusion protein, multidrug efflux system